MSQDLPPEKPNSSSIAQQSQEQQHAARLSQDRARERVAAENTEENSEENLNEASKTDAQPVNFPTKMFVLALCFDVLGFIPVVDIVCVITEPIAGFIFWRWQKQYAPNTNPIKSLLINKAIDLITVGISPSNSILVFRAYSKKKAANMV